MSALTNSNDERLRFKTDEFVKSALIFSNQLPEKEFNGLVSKLQDNLFSISGNIEEGMNKTSRIEKALYCFKINRKINESKQFFSQIEEKNYSQAKDFITALDELDSILFSIYS